MASGASGAELANIVNEAALRAVRDNREYVTQADLEESIEVVIAGYQRKIPSSQIRKESGGISRDRTCSGGSKADKFCSCPEDHHCSPYFRRSWLYHAGRRRQPLPDEPGRLENKIATLTGGRAAEELVFHSASTGASNDIEQATKLARAMITRYGMSPDFDMVALETVTNQYLGGDASLACSAQSQAEIDKQVVDLVKRQHQKASRILDENRGKLDELAQYLYTKETITGEEFMRILEQ